MPTTTTAIDTTPMTTAPLTTSQMTTTSIFETTEPETTMSTTRYSTVSTVTTTILSTAPTTSTTNTTILIIYDFVSSRKDNYLLYLDGGKISFVFLDKDIVVELLKCGYSSIIISYESKDRTRNDPIHRFQKNLTSTNI